MAFKFASMKKSKVPTAKWLLLTHQAKKSAKKKNCHNVLYPKYFDHKYYAVKCYFEGKGCKTSSSIAFMVGMDQSTVYRNLFQVRNKLTNTLKKLCIYAEFDVLSYNDVDPAKNIDLMKTLSLIWNGTDEITKKISKLLMTAHSLGMD